MERWKFKKMRYHNFVQTCIPFFIKRKYVRLLTSKRLFTLLKFSLLKMKRIDGLERNALSSKQYLLQRIPIHNLMLPLAFYFWKINCSRVLYIGNAFFRRNAILNLVVWSKVVGAFVVAHTRWWSEVQILID